MRSPSTNIQTEEFLRLLLSQPGEKEIVQLIHENRSLICSSLAGQADQLWSDALGQQRPGLAQRAALIAAFVHLNIGARSESLLSLFHVHQISFFVADTPEQYESVRGSLLDVLDKAQGLHARDVAFQAAVTAAECSYFILISGQDNAHKSKWGMVLAQDLSAAAPCIDPRLVHSMGSFMSLLCSAFPQMQRQYRDPKEQKVLQKYWKVVASSVEKYVPPDYEMPEERREKWSTDAMASVLASLSSSYGDPWAAQLRLSKGIEKAEARKDLESWMGYTSQLYAIEKKAAPGARQLIVLRVAMCNRIDACRQLFQSRVGRLWMTQLFEEYLSDPVRDELHTQADNTRVFALEEALRARTLLDQIAGRFTDFQEPPRAAQAGAMERDMLRFKRSEDLAPLLAEMQVGNVLPIGMLFDRAERGAMLPPIEQFFKQQKAGFEGSEPTASISQIMQALDPDEALVEYIIPFHPLHPAIELWILVVTRTGSQLFQAPISKLPGSGFIGSMSIDGKAPIASSPLGDWVGSTRLAIQRGDDTEAVQYLQTLYALLVSPLLKSGISPADFKRWIIVPSGMLHSIPFGALIGPGQRPLLDEVAVVQAPSASVWHRLQYPANSPARTLLGLANPALKDLPRLPKTDSEVKQICASLGEVDCEVYVDNKATEAIFASTAPGKNILHLATHGAFPEEDALDMHRLLLSPGDGHDGELHAEEIRRADLHSVMLVTLSICNGGLYRIGPGNEPYGMVAAFLSAGAKNVLSTLWPIADDAGHRLMVEFYKQLSGSDPAQALRLAALKSRAAGAPVRDWASFVITGSGRRLGLS